MNTPNQTLQSHYEMLRKLSMSVELYSGDVEAFSALVCKTGSQALELHQVKVWTIDSEQQRLIPICDYGSESRPRPTIETLPLQALQPLFKKMFLDRCLAIDDISKDPSTRELRSLYFEPNDIRSVVYAMIHCGPDIVGVICFEQVGSVREWSQEETYLAGALADLLGNAYALKERNQLMASLEQQNQLLEEKINLRTNDLEDVLNNQKALLRGLCHDIANSMNVITATCELIHRKGDTRFIDKAQRAAGIIETMLNQTRSFCLFSDRIKTGSAAREFCQSIDLVEVLDKALFILGDRARVKLVQVSIDNSELSQVSALGDPLTLLHSVVCNVLSNAIKFSPQSGRLNISVVHKDQMIGLKIRDYGSGMPPEKVTELLEADGRITSNKGTSQEEGTGYGILQARHYLEKFDGRLEIHSWQEGQDQAPGTEMIIWLRQDTDKKIAPKSAA